VVATRLEGLAVRPPVFQPPGEKVLLYLRRLSVGIILLAVLMAFIAESGIGETFLPGQASPPVPQAVARASDLVAPVLLAIDIVACLVLLGWGLSSLRAAVPEVRDRLTWRLGPVIFTPALVIAVPVLLAVVVFPVALSAVALLALGGGRMPPASLFLGAVYEGLVVAVGWCLMVFPAKALEPWTTTGESTALKVAVLAISAAALFDAGVQFIVAGEGASVLTADPTAAVPVAPPWVQGFSALAAAAALLVVSWLARRIVHRMQQAPAQGAPSPA
jgi:hypothetical protein